MREESAAPLRLRASRATDVDEPDAETVHAFLVRNPDFFLHHESVLAELELPHQAGSAVSLVERQMKLLRERNIESRARLTRLLETAHENDELFTKTRKLVLGLLEANALEQLTQTLAAGLRREFDVEHVRLVLITDEHSRWPEGTAAVDRSVVEAALGGIFHQERPVAGPLRSAARELLFDTQAEAVGSALVAVIAPQQPLGVLALGSSDTGRFHGSMGTLFMEFVAEVVQRLLVRWHARS